MRFRATHHTVPGTPRFAGEENDDRLLVEEAAAMLADRRADIAAAGYDLLDDFVLPDRGWRDEYWVPLAATLERFRGRHAGDPEALAVADGCQQEIDANVRYPGHFGYGFFAMRRRD
jgi:hypothetical protein